MLNRIWAYMIAEPPAPVLLSMNYEMADAAGGDKITIAGTNLGDAINATIGGESAVISANTSGSITLTVPTIFHEIIPGFDGVNDYLNYAASITTLVSNANGSIGVLFYARKADANEAANAKYIEMALFGDTNGNLSLTFSKGGCTISSYNGSTWNSVSVPCSPGDWHYVQARWNGSGKEIRVDGGAWSTVAHTVASLAASNVHIGSDYVPSAPFLFGYVASVIVEDGYWSDTVADDLVKYINARFRKNYGGLGTSAYDPAVRSLSVWLDAGNYSSPTWTGKASAGSSGSNHFSGPGGGANPTEMSPYYAGLHDVVVTTDSGDSNALVLELFSLQDLELAIWQRPSFTPPPPWFGTESFGISLSQDFVTVGGGKPDPVAGTALNGRTPASFASNAQLKTEATLADVAPTDEWTRIVVFKTASIAAGNPPLVNIYDDGALLVNEQGVWGVSHTTLGLRAWGWNGGYLVATAPDAPVAGEWGISLDYYDGSNIYAAYNDGSWSAGVAKASGWGAVPTTSVSRLGTSYNGAATYTGDVAEVICAKRYYHRSVIEKIRRVLECHHAL